MLDKNFFNPSFKMLNYSGKKWGRQIHGGQKEQASINVEIYYSTELDNCPGLLPGLGGPKLSFRGLSGL